MRAYHVRHKNDNILFTVGAENRKQAILLCESYLNGDGDYIDYRVILAKDKNSKPIETKHKGQFDGKQYIEHGIIWWECPECSAEDFEYIEFEKYKCKQCCYVGDIPFAY